MSEDKLAQQLEEYKKLAAEDKKIDVAALMINALQSHQLNLLSDKQKRWAYVISFTLPPFGLLFAIQFYFSGKDDGKQAAWICVTLTAVSLLLFVIFAKLIFSGSGLTVDQVKNINPQDIRDLVQ